MNKSTDVQQIMNEGRAPGVDKLRTGRCISIYLSFYLVVLITIPANVPGTDSLFVHATFNHLITANDSMSFKYWVNEAMPEKVAYRYVCLTCQVSGIMFWWELVLHPRRRR